MPAPGAAGRSALPRRLLAALLRGLPAALLAASCLAEGGAPPAPGGATFTQTRASATLEGAGPLVEVLRVIDGDTIVVAGGDPRGTRVRLIGIDAPERDECAYRAAGERMRALVEGKRVRLVRDVSETDRFGRLLRYVYVGDVLVNAALVREGLATAAAFPPDVVHAGELVALEVEARTARRGFWAPGACAR